MENGNNLFPWIEKGDNLFACLQIPKHYSYFRNNLNIVNVPWSCVKKRKKIGSALISTLTAYSPSRTIEYDHRPAFLDTSRANQLVGVAGTNKRRPVVKTPAWAPGWEHTWSNHKCFQLLLPAGFNKQTDFVRSPPAALGADNLALLTTVVVGCQPPHLYQPLAESVTVSDHTLLKRLRGSTTYASSWGNLLE